MNVLAALLAFAAIPAGAQTKADVLRREVAALAVEVSSEARAASPGVSSPTVAVHDLAGVGTDAPALAAAASDLLRGALLGTGAAVMPAGSAAEFDLRGALSEIGDSWLLTGTLWRRGGPLAAVRSRTFDFLAPSPPVAKPAAAGAAPPSAAVPGRWAWWLTGGVLERGHGLNPLVGIAARAPSGRWDLGLDAARYKSSGRSFGTPRTGFVEEDSLSVLAFAVRAAYRHRISRLGFRTGPRLPFPGALRAGVGLAVFRVTDSFDRVSYPPPLIHENGRSASIHAQPLVEVGLARELGPWLELEARGELMGRTAVRQNLTYGGPSFMLRLSCRFWPLSNGARDGVRL